MKLRLLIVAAVAALALFATKPVYATGISIGTWYSAVCSDLNTDCANQFGGFDWSDPGPGPWTFSGAASVTLLDCCTSGDSYSLFDNGGLIGTTPVSAEACGAFTVADALATPGCTRASFALGAGDHSLTIQSPVAGGGLPDQVFFRAGESTVQTPEPASMLLLAGGLVGLRLIRRRRNQN